MKNRLLFFALLISFSAQSQDSIIALTPIERFAIQRNKPIKTVWEEIGQVGSRLIVMITVTDMESGKRMCAVKLNNNNSPVSIFPVDWRSVYIDSANIEAVIRTLEYLAEETTKAQKADSKFSYTAANDVRVSAAYFSENDNWEIGISRVYHEQQTAVPFTYFRLNAKNVKQLADILKRVKAGTIAAP
jgi:hypothetical protein